MSTAVRAGRQDAKIVIVTDFPSRKDEIRERPLQGQEGKILDLFLQSVKIPRSDCLIVSCIDEYLGHKKKLGPDHPYAQYLSLTQRGKGNYFPDGITMEGFALRQEMQQKLKGCRPNVIVPLGDLALAIMTDCYEIKKWRGSPLHCLPLPGAECIPTWHPSDTYSYGYTSSNMFLRRYDCFWDWEKIERHSKMYGCQLPVRNLIIHPSLDECLNVLEDLHKEGKPVSHDIECLNDQVSCFSITNDESWAICIPMVAGRDSYWSSESAEEAIWLAYQKILGDPKIVKVAQNSMFDHSFLLSQNKILHRGRIDDPMIQFRIMYPDLPSGLDYLASVYTDEPYYKDDRALWSQPWKDIDRFYRYSARDSACLHEAFFQGTLPELSLDPDYVRMYEEDMQANDPLLFMMSKGLRVDEDRLKGYRDQIEHEMNEALKELDRVSEITFNPNSAPQCISYFYGTKGLRPYLNIKTHKPSVDDKALVRIIRKHNLPEARLVQRYRKLKKLHGTYLNMDYDKDGFVRCFYNNRGTKTGRLSSAKTLRGTGMNFQNLDPAFKDFLVVDGE